MSEEEIVGLKEMFKSLDTDNSGTITLEELRAGLPKLGTKISESELMQLMEAVCSYSLSVSARSYLDSVPMPVVHYNGLVWILRAIK